MTDIDLALLKQDMQYMKDDIAETKKLLKDFIDSADSRYASKSIEKALYRVGAVIGVAIIGALMKLILIG